jgi:hypothetical protein
MRLMRQPILELPKEGFSQQEWNVLTLRFPRRGTPGLTPRPPSQMT